MNKLNDIKLQNYKNQTEVLPGLTMEDIVKACLVGKLNLFLVGETGEGKTQLENDILGLFGNKGFFEQGRNDLTIREMFTRFNLDKLRTAKTTEEVKELTNHISHPVYVVDELTRCIPAVQNQFFNLFDGFITVDGTKYKLGKNGYSIGVASGNVGNGRYVGTSETDRALRDRMHLIIDIDAFPKTANDTLEVLASKKDPRVSDAQGNDRAEDIVNLHEEFKKQLPRVPQYVAALHLVHGLDYYEDRDGTNVVPQSKRKNKNAWPGCVKGHDTGSDAALIFPFSTRAAISTLTLAQALEQVKRAKGDAYENAFDPVLDSAYLIGAQSGVLHPSAIDAHHDSQPYKAMQAVIDGLRTEFGAKQEVLEQAIAAARKRELKYLNEFTGRWAYVKDVLERTVRDARQK
jgi:hypothetical protein